MQHINLVENSLFYLSHDLEDIFFSFQWGFGVLGI